MSLPPEPEDESPVVVAERGSVRAEGRDRAGRPPVDVARWCALAVAALEAEGVGSGQVDLHFVTCDEIAGLNQEHLGGSGPTDVVSFPYEDDPRAAASLGGAVPVLGDIVICAEVARAQAPDHAGTFEDELALLVVHGVLHVLGWDHAEPDEATAMQHREAEVLAGSGFGFVHPARR